MEKECPLDTCTSAAHVNLSGTRGEKRHIIYKKYRRRALLCAANIFCLLSACRARGCIVRKKEREGSLQEEKKLVKGDSHVLLLKLRGHKSAFVWSHTVFNNIRCEIGAERIKIQLVDSYTAKRSHPFSEGTAALPACSLSKILWSEIQTRKISIAQIIHILCL